MAGAFVGDTLSSFRQISRGSFRAYIAFEPDVGNFAKLSELAKDDPVRIEVVRAGLARHSGELRFLNTSTADTRVLRDDEPGGQTLPVVGLDEFFASRLSPT
jgi:FkbM family methyltransferase